MKYLVLFAVLLVAYYLWRNARIDRGAGRNRGAAPPAGPMEMVSCAQCGVHLPRPDAVAGADGRLYCSQEHRLLGGG